MNSSAAKDSTRTYTLKARQGWETHPHDPIVGVGLELGGLFGHRSEELPADGNATDGNCASHVNIISLDYMYYVGAHQCLKRVCPKNSSHRRRRSGRSRSVAD